MTFITPTIAADANPGPLVYTELATAMLALGWTLEDTVVIGSRTHKVLKSAAAGNTRGLDWYLDISYPTTGVATGLLLTTFEGYDAATDTALRGPYTANNASIETTNYTRFGATGSALETNWANTGSHTSLDTPLVTTGFGVFASINRDRVILLSTTEASQVSYAGFFTPSAEHVTHAGAALYPLITARLAGASDRVPASTASAAAAALTRVPKRSSINWSSHCIVGPNTMRMNGFVGGSASEVDAKVTTAPFIVAIGGAVWTNGSANFAGQLDGVQCAWGDAAVVRGDTVTVDGDTYCTSTVQSSAVILIKQV